MGDHLSRSHHRLPTLLAATSLILACTNRPATVQPVGPGRECGVDAVNNTGDVVEAWYEPGRVSLGLLAVNESVEFGVDCSLAVVTVYGLRQLDPLSEAQGLRCSDATARLREGDVVMVSLNAPRIPFC